MNSWHQLGADEVVRKVASDVDSGLATPEAHRRLAEVGPNELVERGVKGPWRILWEQVTSTLVLVLIVAALLSGFLGDFKDTVAILLIVILNAVLGFRQEYQAERTMAALKRLAVPLVKVRRDAHIQEISARDLAPGDIIQLEAGNLVPADGRLLISASLRVQEAALTGESEPVEKSSMAIFAAQQPLAERRNMVYRGTLVSYGRGEAVITETGMQTELGHVADLMQAIGNEPTPLQQRLDQLGRKLALVALLIVAVIFGFGLLRGEDWRVMLLTAVSLAVAAIPEGLPAIVTIVLALGAQRMLQRHALIRKLPAVETLGSVTVICSDKTGTLTENRMTVTMLDVAGERIDFAEQVNHNHTDTITGLTSTRTETQPALALLLVSAALCNDAALQIDEQTPGHFRVLGDPTETALAIAAARVGLLKEELDQLFPRMAEAPFDSQRKRMTTVHRRPPLGTPLPAGLATIQDLPILTNAPAYTVITKGALDSLLEISTRVWMDNRVQPLQFVQRTQIMAAHNDLAQKGMRVLGVALRGLASLPDAGQVEPLERNLIFIGMIAMIDPPRREVKAAIQICQTAGIRPLMITGDHPLTARQIAQQLGISTDEPLLTGRELDNLTIAELEDVVGDVAVYARVAPVHKLNIVEALQQRGQIVAMTGDGVNDAPALKRADIGVAMGITGTDVAKEAADIVLQDDNFATIVAAIEEGRVIYDNIRKFIKYLLSCNSGEILVMLVGPLLGMPLPLLPLQILWMNLVTDGFPALALGLEPAERNVMRRPPYPPAESIFSRGVGRDIIWTGLLMGIVSLGLGYSYWQAGNLAWQTITFTTLTLSQMALALAVRSEQDSLFQVGLFSNKAMLGAVGLTFGLQLAVIYVPWLQSIFKTVPLSAQELGMSLLFCTLIFWSVELQKWVRRSRASRF
ncbi:MAG: cation-translocating P-type ATPase [Chloroflexi bacterium]|nr:cation-translocating P-type ATPase [Chloroflexota bacterium]